MLFVRPDYYDSFRCKAGDCRHSCCIGWEIDIDEDTAELYSRLDGELGRELRENISCVPQPHFILGQDERCPFLRQDGLCRLILSLGEAALCDICAEHPRFYNYTGNVTEMGLGACCEEVSRLILEGERGIKLLWEDDGEDTAQAGPLFALREKVLEKLENTRLSMMERFSAAAELCGGELELPESGELVAFLQSLERMDAHWGELLCTIANCPAEIPGTTAVMRMAEYFVYRWFCADDGADALTHLRFAAASTWTVCAVAASGIGIAEALRLYSAEIEYSDENVEKTYEWLANNGIERQKT